MTSQNLPNKTFPRNGLAAGIVSLTGFELPAIDASPPSRQFMARRGSPTLSLVSGGVLECLIYKIRYLTLLGLIIAVFPAHPVLAGPQNDPAGSETRHAGTPPSQDAYFPRPDSEGGWRTVSGAAKILETVSMDTAGLDEAFEAATIATKNGGLLVVRHGWLVYERYYGRGHHEALANLASVGKSFTSVSVGILLDEQPGTFPDGLEQRVYTPEYLPAGAFPIHDPGKSEIKLGQLLAFTAGIRGNNPCYVFGEPVSIDPPGLDGWAGMSDRYALGLKDHQNKGSTCTVKTLWTTPGGGYSYATASIHVASIILRQAMGMELEDFVRSRIAEPIGWGRFSFGYQQMPEVDHTPGGGGIVGRPTDMLRFGYLLLNRGRWSGRQIIPEAYVNHCTNRSPYNPHYPYSLQFNINDDGHVGGLPRDAYWKSGSGGHFLMVVPSLDLVVWLLGGRDSQYDPDNTGLPPHPDALRNVDERPDWKSPRKTEPDRGILILQKVVSSIKDNRP